LVRVGSREGCAKLGMMAEGRGASTGDEGRGKWAQRIGVGDVFRIPRGLAAATTAVAAAATRALCVRRPKS
jgi:hypothetical protein